MAQSDLEKQLRDAMHRAANTLSHTEDPVQSIQHRIRQDEKTQSMRKNFSPFGISISGIGILVVVALFAGMLVYMHAQQSPSQIAKSTSPVSISSTSAGTPGIVGQVAPVTDHEITLQVVSAYADPLGTEIQVLITGTNPQINQPILNDPTLILTDSAGRSFTFASPSFAFGEGGYQFANAHYGIGTLNYLPMPIQQLHTSLQATFVAHSITLVTGTKQPPVLPLLAGTWKSTFTLNPVAGKMYTFHTQTVIHQGIGMQLQSLELAPANHTQMDSSGGIRIILTIIGLPANTLVQDIGGWVSSAYPSITPGGINCPVASPMCNHPLNLTRVALTLPGFKNYAVNSVAFPYISQGLSTQQTVGASGMAQVELLYPGVGTPNGTKGILDISNVQIMLLSNGSQKLEALPGSWTIEIPLH